MMILKNQTVHIVITKWKKNNCGKKKKKKKKKKKIIL
jgi:hypothetical protein